MDLSKIAAAGSAKSMMVCHENLNIFHLGTLDNHCCFIPFAKNQDPFAPRENSKEFELLNGEWGFRYFDSVIDLEDDFVGIKPENSIPVCICLLKTCSVILKTRMRKSLLFFANTATLWATARATLRTIMMFFYSNDRFMGGYIREWCDHAVILERQSTVN